MYKYMDNVTNYIEQMIKQCQISQANVPFYKSRINKFFRNYMSMDDHKNRPLNTITSSDLNTYLSNLYDTNTEKLNSYDSLKYFFDFTYSLGVTNVIMRNVINPAETSIL